jgi:hypothetical protein
MKFFSPYMTLPPSTLILELDIFTLSRDDLRWINKYCITSVIDELVEQMMEYNERIDRKLEFKDKKTAWLPSPSAPRPKLMKKVPRINLPKFSNKFLTLTQSVQSSNNSSNDK